MEPMEGRMEAFWSPFQLVLERPNRGLKLDRNYENGRPGKRNGEVMKVSCLKTFRGPEGCLEVGRKEEASRRGL